MDEPAAEGREEPAGSEHTLVRGPGRPGAGPGHLVLEAIDALAAIDVHGLSGSGMTALLGDVEAATRRLAGIRARLLDALEADGTWALDGSRSFAAWLRRATDCSAPQAWRQARTARALRAHLPEADEALTAGRISVEHADLLARHTTGTPERVAALAHPEIGQAFLVDQATRMDAGDYARLLRAWAIAADPAGADAEYPEQADRQELVLAKALHGYHLQGWLTDADGAALSAALDALIGVPDAADSRSTAQRRAGALTHLARLALDGGLPTPGAAIRPHLNVHVPHDTLLALARAQAPAQSQEPARSPEPFAGAGRFAWPSEPQAIRPDPPAPPVSQPTAGGTSPHDARVIPGELHYSALVGTTPAELDDGTPISPALLARLACDSQLARVIFGPTGEVLDVGRSRRLFPPGQRRAVIARDRTCRYPGCDAPPAHGEIHHSIWWYAQHGTTNAKDGVLLCWYHHDYVHAHRITITRAADRDDSWTFTRQNGIEITARGPTRSRA